MDIELKPGTELRVSTQTNTKIKFVLSEETAEINGQEILKGKWHSVKDDLFFLFTYSGCKLKITGGDSFYYQSEETNMPYVFNVFHNLWYQQKKKVLIVGEGRGTLSNILSNYFIRKEESPLIIDLDIHSGHILFPGTISATVIQMPYSPIESTRITDCISFFYGSINASDNTELYLLQAQEAFNVSSKKNTSGATIIIGHKEISIKEIESIMNSAEVDYLLVIGNEKLCHQVNVPSKIYIPRFPGLVQRDVERRRVQISSRIKRYFYGEQDEYTPCTINVSIVPLENPTETEAHRYKIVQIGDEYMAPMSALPLGTSKRKNSTAVIDALPVEGSVLAISSADNLEDIPTSPAIGYLLVVSVVSETEIRVLSPQPKLPTKPYLVQGKIKILD
ncbi:polyribonucleotide 5'-hydroxyl-kinase [Nematocida sp. AWRm80]|nr:polyribonucleotide 5'-hydroxyl-kinase [Nematocida sp. AWRm80]